MTNLKALRESKGVSQQTVADALLQPDPPAQTKELAFDDFTYAMYEEGKQLTEENKQKLLEMAKFFKQQQEKEKGSP